MELIILRVLSSIDKAPGKIFEAHCLNYVSYLIMFSFQIPEWKRWGRVPRVSAWLASLEMWRGLSTCSVRKTSRFQFISLNFFVTLACSLTQSCQHNPLRPIGSPVTHENWPMNWPDFAASPALLGWPARNRHTAACIHRFSHILRWPPKPVVWFMSESRAVANEHEGYKRTPPIISSSFWMAVGLKGLNIPAATERINR